MSGGDQRWLLQPDHASIIEPGHVHVTQRGHAQQIKVKQIVTHTVLDDATKVIKIKALISSKIYSDRLNSSDLVKKYRLWFKSNLKK